MGEVVRMARMTPAMCQMAELDKHIIGQDEAKRALIRLTNCVDMRLKVQGPIKSAIRPFHAIFHGPTGSGKSALVERHALGQLRPYVKTEATRYTEVGYVGRDVESMIRDLLDKAIEMRKAEEKKKFISRATEAARERILDALVGDTSSEETREIFARKLSDHSIDQKEIEIEVKEQPKTGFEMPGVPGGGFAQVGVLNLGDMFFGKGKKQTKNVVMSVAEAWEVLIEEICGEYLDEDKIVRDAVKMAENTGIVFIDEIDKIASRSESRMGGEVNREGVQRDLLPLLDGTVVNTKHGPLKTHNILFIAAGAFHGSKLSDLLPEFQGRFPIRVKLNALTYNDFVRILRDTEYSLLKQYEAMLIEENVELAFTGGSIDAMASATVDLNQYENTGARRLRSVVDMVLSDITFDPSAYEGTKVVIDDNFVNEALRSACKEHDWSRFIL